MQPPPAAVPATGLHCLAPRRYGRAWRRDVAGDNAGTFRDGREPYNWVADLAEYFADIDDAVAHLTRERGYSRVVLMGNSTAGLTLTMY